MRSQSGVIAISGGMGAKWRSRLLGVAVIFAMAATVAAPASACEVCGHRHKYVIARGKSPHGVPWWIATAGPRTDSLGRRGVEFHFDFGPPAFYDAGYFSGMPLPVRGEFAVRGVPGTGLSPYPESDLSGITGRGVVELVVKLSDGSMLEVHPDRARPALRARFPWLRGLGFYETFYPAGLEPRTVAALDARGRLIARSSARRAFYVNRRARLRLEDPRAPARG
jgi:hypothetical protein